MGLASVQFAKGSREIESASVQYWPSIGKKENFCFTVIQKRKGKSTAIETCAKTSKCEFITARALKICAENHSVCEGMLCIRELMFLIR